MNISKPCLTAKSFLRNLITALDKSSKVVGQPDWICVEPVTRAELAAAFAHFRECQFCLAESVASLLLLPLLDDFDSEDFYTQLQAAQVMQLVPYKLDQSRKIKEKYCPIMELPGYQTRVSMLVAERLKAMGYATNVVREGNKCFLAVLF